MSCSEVHGQALGHWSPDGRHIAGAAQNRLLLRDAETWKLLQVRVCVDRVARIAWAPDSLHVLTEAPKQGVVQIWNVHDGDWQCKIDLGLGGVAGARFGLSARHVLVVSDFQLYLSVWTVEEQRSIAQVQYPKFAQKGIAFSHGGRWLAVLRRSRCRDSLAILACQPEGGAGPYAAALEAPLDADCADLAWVPGDAALVLWERLAGSGRFLWYAPRGELLATVAEMGLPRCVVPSPSAQFLASGGFDGRLHLLSSTARRPMACLLHDVKAAFGEAGADAVVVLQEAEGVEDARRPSGGAYVHIPSATASSFALLRPVAGGAGAGVDAAETAGEVDAEGMPRQGVGVVVWSADERYVATRHESAPAAVWIWDVGRLCLAALLLHRAPVRCLAWDCAGRRLAVSTADLALLFWTPAAVPQPPAPPRGSAGLGGAGPGARPRVGAAVPCPISAARLEWRSDGLAVLLQERERACACWPGSPPEAGLARLGPEMGLLGGAGYPGSGAALGAAGA